VVVGRAAESEETFQSSADVFGPGEILHCSGILGASVTDALPVLREEDLTVRWSGSSEGDPASAPSGYVADGIALSPTEVMLDITPTAPDWPEFRSWRRSPTRAANGAEGSGTRFRGKQLTQREQRARRAT
jgi:hypothetical protein